MGDSDDPPPARVDTAEFFLDGEALSALLVHGLTGTPYEMRFLGEQLARAGVRVLGVKLAGHAGAPEELGATDHTKWYESAVDGFERLRRFRDPIVAVGLSMGAVLATRLAMEQGDAVSGLVLLAPVFLLPRRVTLLLRIVGAFGSLASRIYLRSGGADIYDADTRRVHPSAGLMPLSAPLSLLELSALVRPKLRSVVQPVLIVHSRRDHTAPFRNLAFVSAHLGSPLKRAVILDKSYHVITVDVEKDLVAQHVTSFVMPLRAGSPKLRATA